MYYANKHVEDADAKHQQQKINCHFIVTLKQFDSTICAPKNMTCI